MARLLGNQVQEHIAQIAVVEDPAEPSAPAAAAPAAQAAAAMSAEALAAMPEYPAGVASFAVRMWMIKHLMVLLRCGVVAAICCDDRIASRVVW